MVATVLLWWLVALQSHFFREEEMLLSYFYKKGLTVVLRVDGQLLPELSRLGTINVMAAAETISRPKAKEFIFANSHFEIIAAHFESN